MEAMFRPTISVLVTDLSKALDCLSHKFLLAELNAYGLETSAVHLIFDYLTNRKQFRNNRKSILELLMFSIYL